MSTQCTVWSFRTKSEENCKAHMSTHGPKDYSKKDKKYSCPYCEYQCDTRCWLTRHMYTHESGLGSDAFTHSKKFKSNNFIPKTLAQYITTIKNTFPNTSDSPN